MYEEKYNKLAKKIRNFPLGIEIIRWANRLATSTIYISYPLLLLLLVWKRDPRLVRLILVPGIAFILVSIFRNHINFPRPYELYNINQIIEKDSKGKSFPSRHVFSAFIIATSCLYISIKLGIILLLLATIIAIIRVLGGVHFIRDVLVGALSGLILALIGWTIF